MWKIVFLTKKVNKELPKFRRIEWFQNNMVEGKPTRFS